MMPAPMHRLALCLPLLLACPADDDPAADGSSSASSDTNAIPPDGSQPQWGDCAGAFDACTMDASICGNHQFVAGICDEDESGQQGFCTITCETAMDCPASPGGTATVICGGHESVQDAAVFILDCSGGATCPDGMECVERSPGMAGPRECAWQRCVAS
jgi:hypothetical protein